ncbi:hypothetical protein ACOMHN_017004 [Nucella lapillus]
MDFKTLLMEADRNHQEAAKQSKQIKRINTNFTTPASKEKASRPRSEAVQKLLDEKKAEERQKREAKEKERRRKERARQDREKEEKRNNSFRIPKKTVPDDPPSDAESFSSISSGEEAKLDSGAAVKRSSSHHGAHQSSSTHADSEKSHKSSSHEHSDRKEHSHRSSSHGHSEKKENRSHSSSHRGSEQKVKHSHKSSSHEEKKEKHSHKSSEHSSSSHSSKHRSSEQSSSGHSHHRSESDKAKHPSEKHKHSSEKRESGSSSKTHSSSGDKHKTHNSSSHSKTSGQNSPKYRHIEMKNKQIVIEDKALIVAENDSSGYITSPDISSAEEEEEPAPSVRRKSSSANNHANHTKKRTNRVDKSRHSNSIDSKEEGGDMPVALIRHHLKPTKDRTGGSLEERAKMLEKLRSIQRRNEENDPGPARIRAARGSMKKRRAKREKLDGDFTGSCMEKVNYDEEEKPSLKRPEPKPEEMEEKVYKERKHRPEKTDRLKVKKKTAYDRYAETKNSGKVNRFDEMREKPKIKPKPRPRPPPLQFSDLMKLAEQKQTETVKVEVIPKKEKERRPLTQDELDRKQAREDRLKTKDYKDWYKFGNSAIPQKNESEKSDSGGFLRPNNDVVPPKSGSKPFSIPRKNDHPSSSNVDSRPPSSSTNRLSEEASSSSYPVPKSKPHPTRPGMIANKPQAMAQRMNNDRKAEAGRSGDSDRQKAPSSSSSGRKRSASPSPPPKPSSSAAVDKTREGNAWDRLFKRPEYKKMKEDPVSKKRKRVIDSEEEEEEEDYEDDYDDDMDDFIDDGEDEENNYSSIIQKMFNYNRKKYRDEDDDDRNMEASFTDVMKEEARSARIGLQEDLEDIRREEEELRQKKLKKMKGKR